MYQGPPGGRANDYSYMTPGEGPLPDSPPDTIQRNWRRRREYHGKGTSRVIAGGDYDRDMNEDEQEQTETAKQRMAWIEGQMALMRDENFQLQHKLEAEKKKRPPDHG